MRLTAQPQPINRSDHREDGPCFHAAMRYQASRIVPAQRGSPSAGVSEPAPILNSRAAAAFTADTGALTPPRRGRPSAAPRKGCRRRGRGPAVRPWRAPAPSSHGRPTTQSLSSRAWCKPLPTRDCQLNPTLTHTDEHNSPGEAPEGRAPQYEAESAPRLDRPTTKGHAEPARRYNRPGKRVTWPSHDADKPGNAPTERRTSVTI